MGAAMIGRPDYSPAMLRLFLRARAVPAVGGLTAPMRRAAALDRCKVKLRRSANVTRAEFGLAWSGRLFASVPRARLWAVLGHHPSDFDVVLTEDGQEVAHG
jgi:hypothetical protein